MYNNACKCTILVYRIHQVEHVGAYDLYAPLQLGTPITATWRSRGGIAHLIAHLMRGGIAQCVDDRRPLAHSRRTEVKKRALFKEK